MMSYCCITDAKYFKIPEIVAGRPNLKKGHNVHTKAEKGLRENDYFSHKQVITVKYAHSYTKGQIMVSSTIQLQ